MDDIHSFPSSAGVTTPSNGAGPAPLDQLAERIRYNLARMQRAVHEEWVKGLCALAADLCEARKRIPSNQEFSKWLTEEDIDLGDDDRLALLQMGKDPEHLRKVLLLQTKQLQPDTIYRKHKADFETGNKAVFGNSEDGKKSTKSINNNGSARSKSSKTKAKAKPKPKRGKRGGNMEKLDRARVAVKPLLKDGQSINTRELGKQIGVSHVTIDAAIAAESAIAKALAEAPQINVSDLSLTAQQKLQSAIRQETRRLETTFEERVRTEVADRFARLKERRLPELENDLRRARTTRERYEELINKHRPIFSMDQFNAIRRCLHPDSRNAISGERLAEAFRLFEDRKFVLTGQK